MGLFNVLNIVVLAGRRRTPYAPPRDVPRKEHIRHHFAAFPPRPAPVEEVRWRHRCLWIHLLNRLPWRVIVCCSRQQQQQQQYQPKQENDNDNVDNSRQSGGAPQPSSDGEAPRKVGQTRTCPWFCRILRFFKGIPSLCGIFDTRYPCLVGVLSFDTCILRFGGCFLHLCGAILLTDVSFAFGDTIFLTGISFVSGGYTLFGGYTFLFGVYILCLGGCIVHFAGSS